jgi:hypothetical protein
MLLITGQTAIADLKEIQTGGVEFPVLQKPFHPAAAFSEGNAGADENGAGIRVAITVR